MCKSRELFFKCTHHVSSYRECHLIDGRVIRPPGIGIAIVRVSFSAHDSMDSFAPRVLSCGVYIRSNACTIYLRTIAHLLLMPSHAMKTAFPALHVVKTVLGKRCTSPFSTKVLAQATDVSGSRLGILDPNSSTRSGSSLFD